MNPQRTLCTWAETFEAVTTCVASLAPETIGLREASGRITASPLLALSALPAYATSAMDGWAVSGEAPWRIIGEVATGTASNVKLEIGQCLKISTGGVVPAGCTSVVPWEDAQVENDTLQANTELGTNIRPAATEAVVGDVIVDADTRLVPTHLGLLAAVGIDSVIVRPRPRIAVLLLGDELIHEGLPHDGKIRDALGVQLPAFLEACGAEVTMLTFLEDDPEVIAKAFAQAFECADLVISTGGTADGPKDFAKFAIEHFDMDFIVDRVRMRPGYHFLLATKKVEGREVPYIALPGNPQSAIASLTSFGIPLIDVLAGLSPQWPTEVTISSAFSTPPNFARVVLGRVENGVFSQGEYLGSAMLRGLAASDGFALIAPGDNPAGAPAHWLPLPFSPNHS